MVGRFRTPYSVSRSGTSTPNLKRSRLRYPLAFILSSLILLFSASAFPFDTPWRMAFRIPYSLFTYRFSRLLHHGDITVSCQRQPSLPVTASFLAPWPVPDILCQFFQRPALARQLHLCTQPYQLFLPGFSHPLIAVLPQEAGPLCLTPTFNRKVRMFILAGFINHLAQLLCNMEAVEGDFSQPHWVSGYALLLCSLRSCPLRAF
ncbi:Uncharacterised protein [Klebsiella pneumoniae subsp. rhinoscleromatis]|nr:Uncharacterised protein [Klebsiella pneumoniae subsp. rhinoscleromatis]